MSETIPREHDLVALVEDLPAEGLHAGDVGAVVHCYRDGDMFEVEFLDEHGRSKRVATIAGPHLIRLNLLSLSA
jgi:hypothetical protein